MGWNEYNFREVEELAELLGKARHYFEQEELQDFMAWLYSQDHPRYEVLRTWMNGLLCKAGVPPIVLAGAHHGEHYTLLMQNLDRLSEKDRQALRTIWRTAVAKLA